MPTAIHPEAEIIHGENADDFRALIDEVYAAHRPVTIDQREAADALARAYWNLRRFARADAQLWMENMRRTHRPGADPNPLGDAVNYGDNKRLDRRWRSFHSISRPLRHMRKVIDIARKRFRAKQKAWDDFWKFCANSRDDIVTIPEPDPPSPLPIITFLGFVPSKP